MDWQKVKIVDEDGQVVEAQAPVIVSASRSTDIPAFYAEWLKFRLQKGFVKWTNPFNGARIPISFEKTRLLVFWTKNPQPLIDSGVLEWLEAKGINYYFQFTLNDYETEGLELQVPPLTERIETFKRLSDRIGKEKVIWRFDPLVLMKGLDSAGLIRKVQRVGEELYPYTSRLVFSFADIEGYDKVKRNLKKANVAVCEFDDATIKAVAQGLSLLNEKWGLALGTCAEKVDLSFYGVEHNRCVDDRLIAELFAGDHDLMRFLGIDSPQVDLFGTPSPRRPKKLKDAGQREVCGCIKSKDIGAYNTCPHLCLYCYANATPELARKNYERHLSCPVDSSILGG